MKNLEEIRSKVEIYLKNNGYYTVINLTESDYPHIVKTGVDILYTKWLPNYVGGGFATSVVNNDLQRATMCADITNIRALKFYALLLENTKNPLL